MQVDIGPLPVGIDPNRAEGGVALNAKAEVEVFRRGLACAGLDAAMRGFGRMCRSGDFLRRDSRRFFSGLARLDPRGCRKGLAVGIEKREDRGVYLGIIDQIDGVEPPVSGNDQIGDLGIIRGL